MRREDKKQLAAWIPKTLHQRFKAQCAAEGVDMQERVLELVEGYVDHRRVSNGRTMEPVFDADGDGLAPAAERNTHLSPASGHSHPQQPAEGRQTEVSHGAALVAPNP